MNMHEKISETLTRYGPEGQPIYGSIDAASSSTAKDFAYRPINQNVRQQSHELRVDENPRFQSPDRHPTHYRQDSEVKGDSTFITTNQPDNRALYSQAKLNPKISRITTPKEESYNMN